MNGRKIVVTGGTGFIGSNLTRELAHRNRVIVLDDLSTGYLKNIQDIMDSDKIEFIRGSVTDLELLQKVFRNVDYVFHEAAIPSVPRSVKDPISSNYANIDGTLNVLVAARDNSVNKVVSASSSSIYGDTPALPKREDMKPRPLSPYAVSKLATEYYCQVFTEVYNLPTASLRYFNVYGPQQDPASEYAAVIPKFITRTSNDESPIIYGDGKQTRDFIFVNDVVCANISAAESKATGVFNIAGGKSVTINDLAQSIMNIMGKELDVTYEDSQLGNIMHSLADISKAKKELNFEPRFNLSTGLEETIQWFLK